MSMLSGAGKINFFSMPNIKLLFINIYETFSYGQKRDNTQMLSKLICFAKDKRLAVFWQVLNPVIQVKNNFCTIF